MFKKVLFPALILLALVFCGAPRECFGDTIEKADGYREERLYDQAKAIYKKIIAENPGTDHALRAQEKLTIMYIESYDQAGADAAFQELVTTYSGHERIAQTVYYVADEYVDAKKHKKASSAYEYIVKHWPEAGYAIRAQVAVVRCALLLGDERTAQDAIEALIAKFSGNKDIAQAVYEVAEEYRDREKHAGAQQLYQWVVSNHPEAECAMESQEGVVKSRIRLGDAAGAQAAFDKLIADFAGNTGIAESVDHIGDEYRETGAYEKARQIYRYIVETWAEAEHAVQSQRSVVLSSILLGDDEGAEAAIEKLVTDFGGEGVVEILNEMGEKYFSLGRYDKAIQVLQRAVDNWPRNKETMWSHKGLAKANIALGNDTQAQASIAKLFSDFSGHDDIADAAQEIVLQYCSQEDYDRAYALYGKIVGEWPETKEAMKKQIGVVVATIQAVIKSGDDTNAEVMIHNLSPDFGDHPDLPQALFVIAELYSTESLRLQKEGAVDQSEAYLLKAVDIHKELISEFPGSAPAAEACCFVAGYHHKLGEYESSIALYQKVVDHYPDYRFAWHALFTVGRTYETLKESGGLSESEADAKTKAAYQELLERYPNCKAAQIARDWLSRHKSE